MRRKNVDMLNGPIVKGLIVMFLPILIMNVMTTLFTVVDMAVLRIYANDNAVGAVGASGMLVTLCTSLVLIALKRHEIGFLQICPIYAQNPLL